MRNLLALASLLSAAMLVSGGLHAQAQDAALRQDVDQFYPAERLKTSSPSERYACYEVLERTQTGESSVVLAAYTDRAAGAIRVLRRTSGGMFEVAYDNPANWALPGTDCQVRLHDLDFDGRQEAIVYFLGVRASPGWIVQWDGSTLRNLTPTDPNGERLSSLLLSPAVYDLEHTGSLRVVAAREIERPGPREQPRNPAFVYRFGSSGYEMEKGILGVMGFRADVDPRGNQRSFRLVQDSLPPFTLRVINGDRSGRNRVSGATIRLNNVEVLGPAQVNERTQFSSTVLTALYTDNQLTATLESDNPAAFIIVLIEDSTKR